MSGVRVASVKPRRLTARQAEILAFLRSYSTEHGRPPTMREIGAHFGFVSTNGVNDHLRALERNGAIRRDREVARGIVVLAPVHARPAPSLVLWPVEVHP